MFYQHNTCEVKTTKCSYFKWCADYNSTEDFNFIATLSVCFQQTLPLQHLQTHMLRLTDRPTVKQI